MSDRWQFSLRGMLILTAIVSACLAAAYWFPTGVIVILVLGMVQVGFLIAIDWIIRRRERRLWAIVVTTPWILLGVLLAAAGGALTAGWLGWNGEPWAWRIATGLFFGSAGCFLAALIHLRILMRRTIHKGRAADLVAGRNIGP